MEQFRYRLQVLLDLKIEQKQARELALAKRQQELAAEEQALAELEQEQQRLESLVQQARSRQFVAGTPVDGYTLGLRTDHLRGLASDLEMCRGAVSAQRVRVGEFLDRVAEARQQLVDATREVELLNKHKDRLEKRFLRAIQQKEALEQDELGSIIFNQRRGIYESSR